jgi:hypothetical protein
MEIVVWKRVGNAMLLQKKKCDIANCIVNEEK